MNKLGYYVLFSMFFISLSGQNYSPLKSASEVTYHSPLYFRMSEYPPGYFASVVPAVQSSGITVLKFNVALGDQQQEAITILCGDSNKKIHGNVSIGYPWMDQEARLAVHQGRKLLINAGEYMPLMTVGGFCQSNTMKNTQWLRRIKNDSTWISTNWHDGIWIDGSFGIPGSSTRVWWERNPSENIQAWGNEAHTYMVLNKGNVGIGTADPKYKLEVNDTVKCKGLLAQGLIKAQEIIVTNTGWADFVFDDNYELPALQEVENHIKTYKRLPDIPGEQEVKANGVDLGEMNTRLLQKVEELTLYIIELEKRINKLENNQ